MRAAIGKAAARLSSTRSRTAPRMPVVACRLRTPIAHGRDRRRGKIWPGSTGRGSTSCGTAPSETSTAAMENTIGPASLLIRGHAPCGAQPLSHRTGRRGHVLPVRQERLAMAPPKSSGRTSPLQAATASVATLGDGMSASNGCQDRTAPAAASADPTGSDTAHRPAAAIAVPLHHRDARIHRVWRHRASVSQLSRLMYKLVWYFSSDPGSTPDEVSTMIVRR